MGCDILRCYRYKKYPNIMFNNLKVDNLGDKKARIERGEAMACEGRRYITLEENVLFDFGVDAPIDRGMVKNRSVGNCSGVCAINTRAKGVPTIVKYCSGETVNFCYSITTMGTCGKNNIPIHRQITCPFGAEKEN